MLNPTLGAPATTIPSFVEISVNALKSTGGALCRLTAPVSLTISDATGTPLHIQGNPAMATFDATPGAEDTRVEFAWMNWCGAKGLFTITAALAGQTMRLEVANGPQCADDSQLSMIWGANHNRSMQGS